MSDLWAAIQGIGVLVDAAEIVGGIVVALVLYIFQKSPFPYAREKVIRIFVGVVVIFLLAFGSLGLLSHINNPFSGSPKGGTSLSSATSSVVRNTATTSPPTSTPTLTTTPISMPSPTLSPGSEQEVYDTIVKRHSDIADSLNSPAILNWQENASCTFTNGSYHVTVPQQGQHQECFATNTSTILGNFAFRVQMIINSGGIGGIVFRAKSLNAASTMYRAQIDNQGYYDIYLAAPQKCNHDPSNPHGHTYCLSQSANQEDGQPNQLAVIAQSGTVYFFINGKYVDKASSDLSASGYIGVFAQYRRSPTDVSFSNVDIWKL